MQVDRSLLVPLSGLCHCLLKPTSHHDNSHQSHKQSHDESHVVHTCGQCTVSNHQVPHLFREPFIETGYRPMNQPISYYMNSLFTVHNELFNVWTHLIAFVAFIYKVLWWSDHVDLLQEPLCWPVVGFTVGTLSYSALSSLAHLFQSHSQYSHYLFFQLDYIGIGLNCTGTSLLLFYFAGTSSFYSVLGDVWCSVYLVGNFVFGLLVCVSCSVAKLCYIRPYNNKQMFLKLGVCGVHLLYGSVPLLHRIVCALFTNDVTASRDLSVHVYYVITFFLSVFFYASYIPERLFPGRFDIIGYSHGLFHTSMAVTSLLQYDAAWLELGSRRHAHPQPPPPSLALIGGGFVTMVTASVVFVACTHWSRDRRVKQLSVTSSPVHDCVGGVKQD